MKFYAVLYQRNGSWIKALQRKFFWFGYSVNSKKEAQKKNISKVIGFINKTKKKYFELLWVHFM